MMPRELTSCERGGGKSAELFTQVWVSGGVVGNTYGTVCGKPQVRYPLTENLNARRRRCTVGRSVPLPTFSFLNKI